MAEAFARNGSIRYGSAFTGPRDIRLRRVGGLCSFNLTATAARGLKVWVHKVTQDGNSQPLPVLVEFHCGAEIKHFDLKLSGGHVVLPIAGEACQLRIALPEREQTNGNLKNSSAGLSARDGKRLRRA